MEPEPITTRASDSSSSLLRVVARNALSQAAGRILLTFLRFGVAVIIVRRAGLEAFGQYALVLSFVYVAEWIADFGQSDIAVRDLASGARRWEATLGALAVAKLLQGGAAALLAWVAVAALGYEPAVVRATLLAGGAILLYAFVLVYRAEFRARMRMDKDVGAEIISAIALAAAVWFVAGAQPTLDALVLCYVGARAVFLVAAAALAGGLPRIALAPNVGREARSLVVAALPLGISGLLVSAYDAMDAMALARWSTVGEVGVFTVATRILMMAVIVAQALGIAVFPLLSAQWKTDREAFARTAQAALDFAVVLGGAIFCATWCGAGGLARVFKYDPLAITTVLQVLSWAILARVLVTILSPMVIVSGRQVHTLWLTGIVVLAKWLALLWLVPGAGAVGAAVAYLVSEIAVGLLPTIIVCQRVAGVSLDWGAPLRGLAAAAAVAGAAYWYGIEATLAQGVAGALVFLTLAAAARVLRLGDLRRLARAVLTRRATRAAP
jgi:O-antigen/teichoic acid export membrane protein